MSFSLDLRERVVALIHAGKHTTNQIARIFGISRSTVQSYERKHRKTGDLRPKKRAPSENYVMNRPMVQETIRAVFQESNDATLAEYCDALEKRCGIRVSLVSMCGYLQQLDLRRKKKTFMHQSAIQRRQSKNVNSSVPT
jgi:transposase